MKKITSYKKATNLSLIILWIGAILFSASMLYSWYKLDNDESPINGNFTVSNNIFVDQLLLSHKDFQLDGKVNLININLNMEPTPLDNDTAASITRTPNRKLMYSKILEQKIQKISLPKNHSDGFVIKPLPQ